MKASLKVGRDGDPPLLRAKLPFPSLGIPLPFLSKFSASLAAHAPDPSFAIATLFDAGPAFAVSFSLRRPAQPFAFTLKTGFGLWGSPAEAPFVITARFSLPSGNFRLPPSFSLHFKPHAGDFRVCKVIKSDGADGVAMAEEGFEGTEEFSFGSKAKVGRLNSAAAAENSLGEGLGFKEAKDRGFRGKENGLISPAVVTDNRVMEREMKENEALPSRSKAASLNFTSTHGVEKSLGLGFKDSDDQAFKYKENGLLSNAAATTERPQTQLTVGVADKFSPNSLSQDSDGTFRLSPTSKDGDLIFESKPLNKDSEVALGSKLSRGQSDVYFGSNYRFKVEGKAMQTDGIKNSTLKAKAMEDRGSIKGSEEASVVATVPDEREDLEVDRGIQFVDEYNDHLMKKSGWCNDLKQGLRNQLKGCDLLVHSSLPLGRRATATVRWRLGVSSVSKEIGPGFLPLFSLMRLPLLVTDKISMEFGKPLLKHWWSPSHGQDREIQQRGALLVDSTVGGSELRDIAATCVSIRRQMQMMQAENQVLKRAMEDMSSEMASLGGDLSGFDDDLSNSKVQSLLKHTSKASPGLSKFDQSTQIEKGVNYNSKGY